MPVFEHPGCARCRCSKNVLKQTQELYGSKAEKALRTLEEGFDDATAVLALPEAYRKRLRTSNSVERMNEEIRRRERVIRIFPNRASLERLIGALLMEMDEKWAAGKKYLEMSNYLTWRAAQKQEEVTLAAARCKRLQARRASAPPFLDNQIWKEDTGRQRKRQAQRFLMLSARDVY